MDNYDLIVKSQNMSEHTKIDIYEDDEVERNTIFESWCMNELALKIIRLLLTLVSIPY